MSLEVKLVEIAPPHIVEDVQDLDQMASLHSRVLETVNLRPDRVQTIYPGDPTTILAYGSDITVRALAPDDAPEGVVARVEDVPLLIRRILSAGTHRRSVTEMPKQTTIIPLGKPKATPGPTLTALPITGMEVSWAIYVPADQGGQHEELELSPVFDSPLVPAGAA